MHEVIDRASAIASGRSHYFTGVPCKRGHLALRWSKNSICTQCSREAAEAWRAAHPERVKELDAQRRKENPGRCNEYKAAWKARNKDKVRASGLEYRTKNPDGTKAATKRWRESNKERHRELIRAWQIANPGRVAAWVGDRRAARLNAVVPWADEQAIRAIYKEAVTRGLSVDHIIPLQHPLVCGLHVQGNLQLLTPSENSRKGNKFDPADFDA